VAQDGFSIASVSVPPPVPGPVAAIAAGRRPDDDDVLTVDELVAWLRLSESTVLKLLSERAIPARKVGHQWRIRRGRVRDWLDGRE
jgi:excisionase family DNA binding protein